MGTLFEQLPRAQIGLESQNFSIHQIAKDKRIILSTENVQKVHSRPKLQGFEGKKLWQNLPSNIVMGTLKNLRGGGLKLLKA